jgi:hypothetical protein
VKQPPPSRVLRSDYLEWVDEQIEAYKDSVPRDELIRIATEVVDQLEVNRSGQYQLTELLLLEEVDRTIFRMLKLPSFRTWARRQAESRDAAPPPMLPRAEVETFEVREARAASF